MGYATLDEALAYLNDQNIDVISLYEAEIREVQNESKLFAEFDIISEDAANVAHSIRAKIEKFITWVQTMITKLKNFVKKVIVKFKTSKASKITEYIRARNIDPRYVYNFTCKDVVSMNDVGKKYMSLAKEITKFFKGSNVNAEVLGRNLDDTNGKYDSLKEEMSKARNNEINMEGNRFKKLANTFDSDCKLLNDTMEDTIASYDSLCKALRAREKEENDYDATKLIQVSTKLVNISTNSVIAAANCLTEIQRVFNIVTKKIEAGKTETEK